MSNNDVTCCVCNIFVVGLLYYYTISWPQHVARLPFMVSVSIALYLKQSMCQGPMSTLQIATECREIIVSSGLRSRLGHSKRKLHIGYFMLLLGRVS